MDSEKGGAVSLNTAQLTLSYFALLTLLYAHCVHLHCSLPE